MFLFDCCVCLLSVCMLSIRGLWDKSNSATLNHLLDTFLPAFSKQFPLTRYIHRVGTPMGSDYNNVIISSIEQQWKKQSQHYPWLEYVDTRSIVNQLRYFNHQYT